jgi:hypothetical protein
MLMVWAKPVPMMRSFWGDLNVKLLVKMLQSTVYRGVGFAWLASVMRVLSLRQVKSTAKVQDWEDASWGSGVASV